MNLSLPTPVTLTTLPSLRWCNALLWITDLMIPILAWQVYSLVYSNLNLITFFFNKIFLYLSIRSSLSPLQSPFNNYKCVLDFLGGDSFTYQRKKTEQSGRKLSVETDPIPQPPQLSFPLFSCYMRNIPKRVIEFGTCLWRTCKNCLGFLDFKIPPPSPPQMIRPPCFFLRNECVLFVYFSKIKMICK